jgi:hypothetical protein
MQIPLGILATEGVYVLVSRYLEFNASVVGKPGQLLDKTEVIELTDVRHR